MKFFILLPEYDYKGYGEPLGAFENFKEANDERKKIREGSNPPKYISLFEMNMNSTERIKEIVDWGR